jgi:hypothetical protein
MTSTLFFQTMKEPNWLRLLWLVNTIRCRRCRVIDLRSLLPAPNPLVCDLALLSLAKQAVELGAVAIVSH